MERLTHEGQLSNGQPRRSLQSIHTAPHARTGSLQALQVGPSGSHVTSWPDHTRSACTYRLAASHGLSKNPTHSMSHRLAQGKRQLSSPSAHCELQLPGGAGPLPGAKDRLSLTSLQAGAAQALARQSSGGVAERPACAGGGDAHHSGDCQPDAQGLEPCQQKLAAC